MVVNLIRKDSLSFITLPTKAKGQFWLVDLDEDGRSRNLISIESENGGWMLKSNKIAWIIDNKKTRVEKAALNAMSFYSLEIAGLQERVSVFAEPISVDRQRLKKILVTGNCELTIGRTEHHHIAYDNSFVSESDGRGHAKLQFNNGVWKIYDQNSTNGTYINGERVTSRELNFGDLIYIMGLRIVVGKSFFAINNPESKVKLKSNALKPYKVQEQKELGDIEEIPAPNYFYRSPRFKREFEKAEIVIDPPPALQKIDQVPLALMLGPSLTMGLTSLSTGILTVSNITTSGGDIKHALPTLFMSVSMLLGTILWPILTKRHEKKMKIATEKKRQEKYLAYLDNIRDDIRRKCKEQSYILNENIATLDDCVSRISEKKRTLWERIVGQDDFLRLRLGRGTMPLNANIRYPEKKFTLDSDSLMDALFSLGGEPKVLKDVPVSVSLVDNYILGIIGPRSSVLGLIRSLLIQVGALHSYDELKIVFIVDGDEMGEWEYARWFPHSWDNEKSVRFLATNSDEVKELSAILEKNILSVREDFERAGAVTSPYYLIIAANKELALKCDSLSRLLEYRQNCGFSIVTLYDEIQNIPKETHSVIDMNGSKARIFDKDDLSGKAQTFASDTATLAITNRTAQMLANIPLDISEQRLALPGMLTFLEMFGVSKIEHLNPLTRWKESNPSISLQTPIGVDVFGEPFLLDLHENFHGPHGLVAGTTGSGKSEFIMTYILSLAVNYHPDEIAFLLIDYKGGGLTGAFEFESGEKVVRLPHLAGTITNLDGAAIKRAMVAIESESKRRQVVFNDAKAASGEGTMDIYKYQRLYREKVVADPIPHLFIISDEFAELKSQQPEFMDSLVSTARVGRSLGIHLILATQKPAGVVDDQIWSNSRFRVCLKVQGTADSNDMLKRPDAAEITQTGRFYLQVGFNEIFALGQSAWSGAEYVPTDIIEKKVDSSVQVMDFLGRVIRDAKPSKKTTVSTKRPKQLVALVNYLAELAAEEKITERQLWKEPIPEFIYVDRLERTYGYKPTAFVLNPLVGEYDDPYNQRQVVLTLPLSAEGNCIVYGAAGNGKTTFLSTLIYSIIKHHGADEVNIYALDFGSETLTAFANAPQVGGILLAYESEKIGNLIKMLRKEFETRRSLFARYGGDLQGYNKNSGKTLPNILVLINNYIAFAEQFEEHDETFEILSREGLKYGISFVLTVSATTGVKWRIEQNFKQKLALQLNDDSGYRLVLGKTGGLLPSKLKGRGLVSLDRVYEFQTAYATDNSDLFGFIRRYADELRAKSDIVAKPVPILPDTITVQSMKKEFADLTAVPIGISKRELCPVKFNLASKFIVPVLAQETYLLQQFIVGLSELFLSANYDVSVYDAEEICNFDPKTNITYLADNMDESIRSLSEEMKARHELRKSGGSSAQKAKQLVVVICGIKRLKEQLSADGKDKLKILLESGESAYNIHFVMADTAQNFRSNSSEQWYRKHVTNTDGIWIGDGFTNQTVLTPTRTTSDLYEDIGEEFGYLLNKSRPTLIKLLSAQNDVMEDAQNE